MKVNLTKKNVTDLESTIEILSAIVKHTNSCDTLFVTKELAHFNAIKEARRLKVDLQEILTKHDNRKEKDY